MYTQNLNLINTFCMSDADVLTILNSEPQLGGLAGMGSNNEYALNEISQWPEERHMSHVPVSMGDLQRRYQQFRMAGKKSTSLLSLRGLLSAKDRRFVMAVL